MMSKEFFRALSVVAGLALLFVSATSVYAQYDRNVLLEDFSSVTCVNCPAASAIVAQQVEENERVVSIQYHLDIPGRNDPFYAQNKPDNDNRANFYGGFNGLPQVFVNGVLTSGTSQATVRGDVNFELERDSPIGINITQGLASNSSTEVDVSVEVVTENGLQSGYSIYAVVVEKFVERPESFFMAARSQPYYNETEFHDLFRKIISPLDGEEVSFGQAKNIMFDYSYTLAENWEPKQMYVIAWVQDDFNNEVIQVGFSETLQTTSVREVLPQPGFSFSEIVPNPSTERVIVDYALGQPQDVSLTLYNSAAEVVGTHNIGRQQMGEHSYNLDLSNIRPGVYTVVLQSGLYTATQKLIVVR